MSGRRGWDAAAVIESDPTALLALRQQYAPTFIAFIMSSGGD